MEQNLTSKISESISSIIIDLYESYENVPLIKGLIQAIPFAGIPDSIVGTYVNKLKAKRLKIFFDQLTNGDIQLTEDIISNDNFLHAFFATTHYVVNSRSDLKLKAFAEILKSLYRDQISIDQHEDYAKIFDELTEREFIILSTKNNFERKHENTNPGLNQLQHTSTYWNDFKTHVTDTLEINEGELNSMLIRIQRTGCYIKYVGYMDESQDQIGHTSEIFRKLKEIINIDNDAIPT